MERLLTNNVLPEAANNFRKFFDCKSLPSWASDSLRELVDKRLFEEINNRFFATLKFGTGGMRGRTISEVITKAERGNSSTNKPDFASLGSAYLNDFNVIGATISLFRYCKNFLRENNRAHESPSVVIAYDVRHFSKHFCKVAASTWKKLGGHVMIYSSPRSTPQLSFSVRYLRCTAGIMITASHNPWHDNGFKAYFSDGAQIVDPHATRVIEEFNKLTLKEICKFYTKRFPTITILDKNIDEQYQIAAAEPILRRDILRSHPPRIVFSPLHGTGAIATVPMLKKEAISYKVVDSQNDQDPNFSTVPSPNPENHCALKRAIELGKTTKAEIILATDPDGDRLAVAAKNKYGDFEPLTGNVTGALLTNYRISQLKTLGKIPQKGSERTAVIKTFVTTPLIDKIAARNGVKCVNTLTGFKWIGQKMLDYQNLLLANEKISSGIALDYMATSTATRQTLLMQKSTLFLFGCEESYGCLANDNIRDKDANSACLMVCEMAAYAKSLGKTLLDMRDDMYLEHGYFGETVFSVHHTGASGAQKIKNILASYRQNPPKSVENINVTNIIDFSNSEIRDPDGKKVPAENFFFVTLENSIKFAVRGSGTEPKIKFYLFTEAKVKDRKHLPNVIKKTSSVLASVEKFLRADAESRSHFSP